MTITEKLEKEMERIEFENFKNELRQYLFLKVNSGVDINIENKIKKRKKFLNDFEKEVEEALRTGKVKYTIEELKLSQKGWICEERYHDNKGTAWSWNGSRRN